MGQGQSCSCCLPSCHLCPPTLTPAAFVCHPPPPSLDPPAPISPHLLPLVASVCPTPHHFLLLCFLSHCSQEHGTSMLWPQLSLRAAMTGVWQLWSWFQDPSGAATTATGPGWGQSMNILHAPGWSRATAYRSQSKGKWCGV